MQLSEIELMRKLLTEKEKKPVRVAVFLLEEIEKLGFSQQDYVNLAVAEKLLKNNGLQDVVEDGGVSYRFGDPRITIRGGVVRLSCAAEVNFLLNTPQ